MLSCQDVMYRNGRSLSPGKMYVDDKYVYFDIPFGLKDEVKPMKGARWSPDGSPKPKLWRVDNCERNWFQINYLLGQNPYARYLPPLDKSIFQSKGKRTPYSHQLEMSVHGLQRKQCLICGEMGTGKTLAAIEIMEQSHLSNWWYVAPKSALTSVRLECEKWFARVRPVFLTYEELLKTLRDNPPANAPHGVIFDEISRCKTPTSQRSQAAMHLANSIRKQWKENGYVIGMTGSPAPKSPADFYWPCEIVCPGFLREGDYEKFKNRLAVITYIDDVSGGKFPKLMCWRNGDPTKCNLCGSEADHRLHTDLTATGGHAFVPLANELETLYKRLKGIAYIVLKKDCLDLPEKTYKIIKCKPNLDTIRAMRLIQASAPTAISALIQCRELSDGFQYRKVVKGETKCGGCEGHKQVLDTDGHLKPCELCQGQGSVKTYANEITSVPTPKLDALAEVLDELNDVGRCVVFAGFKASIDRLTDFCKNRQWEWIRIDGRGWASSFGPSLSPEELIKRFQDVNREDSPDRCVIIAHPASGGMGLTLTASPVIVYYSNDFSGEARIQSEDRIHRAGMDTNRGATIIDLIHLPTDLYVRENLKIKKDMQNITMGDLQSAMELTV